MDFGGLGEIKDKLRYYFDHTVCISEDDPHLHTMTMLDGMGLINLRIMKAVGTEMFAKLIADFTIQWMKENGSYERVRLDEVEVREHGANSAILKL